MAKKYEPSDIPPREFDFIVNKLRGYCTDGGLTEVGVQHRRSILAACEDPQTISTFNHGGMVWPLPQTGQMQLEFELLKSPQSKGFHTLSYSYRNEPEPVEGRHQLIFPLAEFEIRAETSDPIKELIDFEMGLLAYLGFDMSEAVVLDWQKTADMLQVDDIDHAAEERLWKEVSPIVFLTHFPQKTEPFWNMKINEKNPNVSDKVDVILYGQETFGSASRSCDTTQMRESFRTVSNGKYASLLYSHFTKERVDKEMDEYLDFDFIPRYGGGIGFTRLLRAMKLAGILKV